MPRRPPRPGALADLAPLRIFTQIVVLQICYYASALILIVFTALAAGKTMELGLILDWHSLRGDVTDGWMLALCWMFSSLITVIYLLLLIARSKLIPDFALTIHFIHLMTTSFYTRSIPRYLFWWGLQAASAALMTFLGIWACQWRELRPINFGGAAASTRNDVEQADNDDGVGYPRGRGSRLRGGGGAYELMSLKPNGVI